MGNEDSSHNRAEHTRVEHNRVNVWSTIFWVVILKIDCKTLEPSLSSSQIMYNNVRWPAKPHKQPENLQEVLNGTISLDGHIMKPA